MNKRHFIECVLLLLPVAFVLCVFVGMRAYVVCCLTHWCIVALNWLKLYRNANDILWKSFEQFPFISSTRFLLLFCWLLFLASWYTYTQIWWPLSIKIIQNKSNEMVCFVHQPTDRSHSRASLFLVISLLKMFSSSSVYGTNTCIGFSLVFYWEI